MAFVIKFVLAVLAIGLLTIGVFRLTEAADRRNEFRVVCTYEGGTVEGGVCIKDGEVILYKDTLDLEHQD